MSVIRLQYSNKQNDYLPRIYVSSNRLSQRPVLQDDRAIYCRHPCSAQCLSYWRADEATEEQALCSIAAAAAAAAAAVRIGRRFYMLCHMSSVIEPFRAARKE